LTTLRAAAIYARLAAGPSCLERAAFWLAAGNARVAQHPAEVSLLLDEAKSILKEADKGYDREKTVSYKEEIFPYQVNAFSIRREKFLCEVESFRIRVNALRNGLTRGRVCLTFCFARLTAHRARLAPLKVRLAGERYPYPRTPAF
jgi:hypothetical protein